MTGSIDRRCFGVSPRCSSSDSHSTHIRLGSQTASDATQREIPTLLMLHKNPYITNVTQKIPTLLTLHKKEVTIKFSSLVYFFFRLTLELWICKHLVRLLLREDDPLRGLYMVVKYSTENLSCGPALRCIQTNDPSPKAAWTPKIHYSASIPNINVYFIS